MIEPKKNEKQTRNEETKKASFRLRTHVKAGTGIKGGVSASDDWETPMA